MGTINRLKMCTYDINAAKSSKQSKRPSRINLSLQYYVWVCGNKQRINPCDKMLSGSWHMSWSTWHKLTTWSSLWLSPLFFLLHKKEKPGFSKEHVCVRQGVIWPHHTASVLTCFIEWARQHLKWVHVHLADNDHSVCCLSVCPQLPLWVRCQLILFHSLISWFSIHETQTKIKKSKRSSSMRP